MGIACIIIAMIGMLRAKALRQEHFDGTPQKFVARVSEQIFRLGINLDNPAVLTCHDDGVRRMGKQLFVKPIRIDRAMSFELS